VTVSRPPANGKSTPSLFPTLTANQLDRAEFLGRFVANVTFLAPFAFWIYAIRSKTGSGSSSEFSGCGLLALAVPVLCTIAPWSATKLPMRFRGKASLFSQCDMTFGMLAVIAAVAVYCFTGTIDLRTNVNALLTTARPKKAVDVPSMSKETFETLADIANLAMPFYATTVYGVHGRLIVTIYRIEATRLDIHKPTEAQIEANRQKDAQADKKEVPTDVHGRRPVTLAEAELAQEEMGRWIGEGKSHLAVTITFVTILANWYTVEELFWPVLRSLDRDDFENRFYLACNMWGMHLLTPMVVVPLSGTIISFVFGGFVRVKQLWAYTEQWGVNEREKHRLKDLAQRRKMLAATSTGDLDSSLTDRKESAEVEALLVSEKP
jgi:uncharacterized protein (UPF0333 family)